MPNNPISITPEIQAAFDAYLNEPIDSDFSGAPILRKNTYPYNTPHSTGVVSYAAGWQAGAQHERNACESIVASAMPGGRFLNAAKTRELSALQNILNAIRDRSAP